ncbi:MAG: hypothetical protein LWX54_00385, partial [Deltaproteobacteria bacterium]|nr:hypothetical protein [Deltaproteobacteria bacterium]
VIILTDFHGNATTCLRYEKSFSVLSSGTHHVEINIDRRGTDANAVRSQRRSHGTDPPGM